MLWGIILYEAGGKYLSFVLNDDRFYNVIKESMKGPYMKFLGGKKGIRERNIKKSLIRQTTW